MRKLSMTCAAATALLASSLPSTAWAQWNAKAEAGIVAARGNTDTESANTKLDVTREFVKWKHSAGFTGVYASDETGTTGQRWEARGQSDYGFHARGFWFGSVRFEDDRFSGFEYQTTYGTGLGWHFFDDPLTTLDAQLGAGYKVFQTRDSMAQDGASVIPGMREENLIVQGTVNFEHALTETTTLLDKLLVESGADNTFMQNDLNLQVRINSSLALAVGYSVRYNTDPPAGFTTTDTLTTLNLVYELK